MLRREESMVPRACAYMRMRVDGYLMTESLCLSLEAAVFLLFSRLRSNLLPALDDALRKHRFFEPLRLVSLS